MKEGVEMMDNIEEYRGSKAYVTMLSDDSFIAGLIHCK